MDIREVRALIRRASAGLGGSTSLDGPLDDAEQAVHAAEMAGDAILLLDALEVRAQALTGLGDASAEDWRGVEHAARVCEAWPRAANALRMQVMRLLDDHAALAEAPAIRLTDVASREGSTVDLAWAEAARAEIAFVEGRWDEAATFAMRAISAAGRVHDSTAMLRAWHVLTPIASARDDETRLSLAVYAYSSVPRDHIDITGASPYRALLDTAAAIRFAQGGAERNRGEMPRLDIPMLLRAMSGAAAMPHWLAAVETVIERLIIQGDLGAAERALEQMAGSHKSGNASGLGAAVESLLRARLLCAEGAMKRGIAAHAWTALEGFSKASAPWWISKAIRIIGRAGEATPSLRAEALRIERALRLVKH